jgi:serine/threonine protein kinase/Leucine-rich repeat (LRR) protein
MINLTCPRCLHSWSVDSLAYGFSIVCPGCGDNVELSRDIERTTEHASDSDVSDTKKERGLAIERVLEPAKSSDELGWLGQFRVTELLGEGGMGFVFRAEDPKLRRVVALKVMRPEVAINPVSRKRFLREAQAAAGLTHDHILPIFLVDEANGVPFIAMPLLKGETVSQRLERIGAFTVEEAVRIGRETAEGLHAAHDFGLIHRDIKPANLWLESPRGRVKILDFGLARRVDNNDLLSASGAIIGSPAYMAPEQAAGKAIDARADLFSLGCVLFQMTTGRKAFDGSDVITILNALANYQPPLITAIKPGLPETLARIVEKLLQKNPNDRFRNAAQLGAALAQIDLTSIAVGVSTQTGPALSGGAGVLSATDTENRELTRQGVHDRTALVDLESPKKSRKRAIIVASVGFIVAISAYLIWNYSHSPVNHPIADSGKQPAELEEGKTNNSPTKHDPPTPKLELPAIPVPPDLDAWNRDVAETVCLARGSAWFPFPGAKDDVPAGDIGSLPKPPFRIQLHRIDILPETDPRVIWPKLHDLNQLASLFSLGSTVDDAMLLRLQRLPKLSQFDAMGSRIKGHGLRVFKDFPQLTRILIGRSPFTDSSLGHLESVTQIQTLTLIDVAVRGDGLAHLRNHQKLTELSLMWTLVNDEGLSHLPTLPNLKKLDLTANEITDDGFLGLERFPSLTTIVVTDTRVTAEAIEKFRAQRPNLMVEKKPAEFQDPNMAKWIIEGGGAVVLWGSDKIIKNVNDLPTQPAQIKEALLLNNYKLNDIDSVKTVYLRHAKRIVFGGTPNVTVKTLEYLKALARLESLEFGLVEKPKDWLARLDEFPQLIELTLPPLEYTADDLRVLAQLPELQKLHLHNSRFGPGTIERLMEIPKLTALDFDICPITDGNLSEFAQFKNLKTLKFMRTQVTPEGVSELQSKLPGCRVELAADPKPPPPP